MTTSARPADRGAGFRSGGFPKSPLPAWNLDGLEVRGRADLRPRERALRGPRILSQLGDRRAPLAGGCIRRAAVRGLGCSRSELSTAVAPWRSGFGRSSMVGTGRFELPKARLRLVPLAGVIDGVRHAPAGLGCFVGRPKNRKAAVEAASAACNAMVGTGRFELPTPRTPSECSTRLSHVPTYSRGLLPKFSTQRPAPAPRACAHCACAAPALLPQAPLACCSLLPAALHERGYRPYPLRAPK
jgi:hypothetical protein